MSSTDSFDYVGVIGAGSFGTALSNILAENRKVLLYSRRPEKAKALQESRRFNGHELHERIEITNELERVTQQCTLVFPIVPSEFFPELLGQLGPLLRPDHILIHGTKGLHVDLKEGERFSQLESISRDRIKTMSELIMAETVVKRVGCVAGPNIAAEIAEGQPAATVVASHFEEVIREGKSALRSSFFRVHDNKDLFGIELAGVLKNIMAIAAGITEGLGYGYNTRGLLITRGLAEMVTIGTHLGADPRAFLGLAGIGDLLTTCSSPKSRNFAVGLKLAKGEKLDDILAGMDEVAEGLKTLCLVRALGTYYKIPVPISRVLHRIIFGEMEIERAIRLLMEYPYTEDVEFI